MLLPDKWNHFGTSIFSVMTATANAAKAVNLAQGFPDFDAPDQIKAAAIEAITNSANQYAPATGLQHLRILASERRKTTMAMIYDLDTEVTICTGATEGLFSALQAICVAGDEVITFAPFYDSYPAAVHAAGAVLRQVPLHAPQWTFEPAELEKLANSRTRAIIVNSPHNPTGRVFSKMELQTIADFCLKHDLLAITDEVYEEIWFGAERPLSLSQLDGMRDRTMVISSAAKTYSVTGWKIGYVFAPAPLSAAFRAVHQFTVFCSATPLQHGVIAGLQLRETFYEELRRVYKARLEELAAILHSQGFRFASPEGSYFILADYSAISEMPDVDFALWLTKIVKVAAVPISPFFLGSGSAGNPTKSGPRFVRFAFCKKSETLQAAAANFKAFFKANPLPGLRP